MAEVRLICKSPDGAAVVVAEATRPGDTGHTVRQEGHTVLIGYYDARFPLDVADWAFSNGHAWDEDAAAVIASLGRSSRTPGRRLAMGEPMRALTVVQPWATALIWGGKDVENRTRPTRHRGRLWIHAGLQHPDWGDYLQVRALSGIVFGWTDTRRASADELERARRWTEHTGALGVILGSVEVVGCHRDGDGGCSSPWAQPLAWHWMLANPQPLSGPVPCKGMLGLWRLPGDVEKAVRAQVSEDENHGR